MNYIVPFLSALLGAGVLSFIQFLIERHDHKDDKLSEIEKKIEAISAQMMNHERDQCRTQMLLLISDYPKEYAEIMKVAEHYFSPSEKGGLSGDWYLTNLFNRFLTQEQLGKPEWFDNKV